MAGATDACPQCGQHPGALPASDLGGVAVDSAGAWRELLATDDDGHLRTNPAPGVWSPIQYGAHVRDMLVVFGDRILLAVAEDDPNVPWFDPGEDGWDSYNRLDRGDLADDIERQATRLAAIVGDRTESDWSRTARRDGVDSFTVAGLACFGVHEAHHHLLDAAGRLPA